MLRVCSEVERLSATNKPIATCCVLVRNRSSAAEREYAGLPRPLPTITGESCLCWLPLPDQKSNVRNRRSDHGGVLEVPHLHLQPRPLAHHRQGLGELVEVEGV